MKLHKFKMGGKKKPNTFTDSLLNNAVSISGYTVFNEWKLRNRKRCGSDHHPVLFFLG
jgi:hypothetical protein